MLSYNFDNLPLVLMTGRVTEKEGWSHSGRTMPVNLLVVFHSGNCLFNIGGKEYSFGKGDVAIVPKNVEYSPKTDSFCDYTFFHFDGDFVPSSKAEKDIKPFDDIPLGKPSYGLTRINEDDRELLFDHKITLGAQAQNIELLIRKCVNTRLNYESKQQLLLSIELCEIMFHISQAFCERFGSKNDLPPQLNRLLSYIKANYTSQITLDDICKNMNMSKQYCMRIFKRHMRTTINDYILDLRMRHAAYLLSGTYMNVSQTADYLGFTTTAYFSRVFKKYYGVSPSEYVE